MNRRVLVMVGAVGLFIAVLTVLILTHKIKGPVIVSRTDPPKIRFEEEAHDLGPVVASGEIPYVFRIRNVGGEPLIIENASTTSDDVIVNLHNKVIDPGKTGDLEVIVNTDNRQGPMRQIITILSNDPRRRNTHVTLAAKIVPADIADMKPTRMPTPTRMPHPAGNSGAKADNSAAIAAGGLIFKANCAVCHGLKGEGGSGPTLIPGAVRDAEHVANARKMIRNGSEPPGAMPAFGKDNGGPLSETDITALILFLQSKDPAVKPAKS